MKEYWVNVYMGIQPYQCHKFKNKAGADLGLSGTLYDYPVYRIHVKMKSVEPRKHYNSRDKRISWGDEIYGQDYKIIEK